MTSASRLLSLSDISKTYETESAERTPALSKISTEIAHGSFVSLVGPSGCGKSTLLRIIAGLIPPTSGRVSWEDGMHPADIGFVFQDATLMPWARVFENVFLPLKLKGMSRDAAAPRIEAALARVGLSDVSRKFPRELSGGMKMRVSIARALVTHPPVLLMDEPFAALDEFTREALDDDLLSLWRSENLTIIFVTHSVYESVYLSERVLVMGAKPGRIVDDICIEAPVARNAEFRGSPSYMAQCTAISAALRGAMTAGLSLPTE